MAEIVTKEQYWIDILNDNSKFGQITTEDTSFNLRANDVWRVIENSLLVTEDEEDVANWEGITQLSGEGLTIFQRKVNILYVLSTKSYVPVSLVEEIATKTSGKDVEIFYDKEQGKLIVHTDRAEGDTVEITNSIINKVLPDSVEIERYNHNLEISWDNLNKYAECKNRTDMVAVNPNYKLDLPSDGEWVYLLPAMTDANNLFQGTYQGNYVYVDGSSPIKKIDMSLPNLTSAYRMFSWCEVESVRLNAPKLNNFEFWACSHLKTVEITGSPTSISFTGTGAITVVKISDTSKITRADNAFDCAQKLEEFPLSYPALNSAVNMFRDCKLSSEQVINVLDSLPSWQDEKTHSIGFGIHVDYQADEEVLAAIDAATAKGWTVTTRFNGTATASTFTLRPTPTPPVYAKREPSEYGRSVDTTGSRFEVDWWHEIYSPDGKSPEELGYQEFASLEEALTTWGLTEIMEIPEQES